MTLTPPGVACRLGPGELVTLAVSYPLMPPSGARPRLTHGQLTFAKAIVGTGRKVPPAARRAVAYCSEHRLQTRRPACAIVCAIVRNACKRRFPQNRACKSRRGPIIRSPRTGACAGVSASGAAQESNLPSPGLPDLTGSEASAY